MKAIEDKILKDGIVINNDIIKVDSFLNHQIDVKVMREFAFGVKEFFKDIPIDKVLTIETSGIAVAYSVAEVLGDKLIVFAKKSKSAIVDENVYTSSIKSFTRNSISNVTISKRFLLKGERILIIDDFLAEGNAAMGLVDMCNEAGSKVVGYATVIEKAFQGGRKRLEEAGIPVFSGAIIKAFENNKPVF